MRFPRFFHPSANVCNSNFLLFLHEQTSPFTGKKFMIEESACIVLYHPQHIYQEGRTVDGIAHLQDHRAVPPTKYTVALLLL